tara:strand:- start:16624 stop:16794 length:171 start_codon:yes stop_codon:yes gene_type:complete
MTEAVMKFAFAPLSGFWSGFNNFFFTVGKSRAAAELARMGYQEEARRLMLMEDWNS